LKPAFVSTYPDERPERPPPKIIVSFFDLLTALPDGFHGRVYVGGEDEIFS